MKEPKDKNSQEYKNFINDTSNSFLDKRTKAYKEWKAGQVEYTPEGLGTNIETVLKATGVKKVVKRVFGDEWGCQGRVDNVNDPVLRTKRRPERWFTDEVYKE